jgi:glycogen debranching enzyme
LREEHLPQAQRTVYTLLEENLYSGWGIRTLAASEVRYNPTSYHKNHLEIVAVE